MVISTRTLFRRRRPVNSLPLDSIRILIAFLRQQQSFSMDVVKAALAVITWLASWYLPVPSFGSATPVEPIADDSTPPKDPLVQLLEAALSEAQASK